MMDRVREALFSSLGTFVLDAAVLDLYAGTGSIGLEALSRGAESAVFVESDREALKALSANIETVGLGGRVIVGDVATQLPPPSETFDLVFVDPPYEAPLPSIEHLLGLLVDRVRAGGMVVVHRRTGSADPVLPPGFAEVDRRRYGSAEIVKLAKETA